MPVPPIPVPFDVLRQRTFSFYPPILNVAHNEWHFRQATWSELLVSNAKTGEEVGIPRRFVGELSRIDEPVMILGLTRELEYQGGQVWPHERRVIEIPRAVNESYPPVAVPDKASEQAPVVGIRLESGAESRVGKLILAVLVVSVLGFVTLVGFFRTGRDGSSVRYAGVVQSQLGLTADDDYFAVVRRLGKPQDDRWRSDKGELQYRVLRYPKEGVSLILMGTERGKEKYIGALDNEWRPVDSVRLPNGGSTLPMLRALKRF